MTLTHCQVSNVRTRLSGQLWPRGSQSGLPTWGAFGFGLPFFGFGTWITLVSVKVVHVNPSSVHAPYWVLTVAGLTFFLGGVWMWSMGCKQFRANQRRKNILARDSSDVARADYAWDEKGYTPPRWSTPIKMMGIGLAVTAFLSMFNWWAFVLGGPVFIKVIVGLFDAFLITFWYQNVAAFLRAAKFGNSRAEFSQFPYHLGEPVVLRWLTPTGINRAESGTFRLRCIEQWYERTGRGENSSSTLVQEEVWSSTASLASAQDVPPGKWIELRFDPPGSALPTCLNAKGSKPVFWELVIAFQERGLDFKQTYLVPIYARKSAEPAPVA